MRLLVFLELGADVRIPPERDPRSGRVREEWLVREIDPACARALDLSLSFKAARPSTEVTLVHLGPPNAEPWLRQALARGCDRAVRIWDAEAAEARAAGNAVILAAAARAAGFDLVLTGAAGAINGSGQLGVLLAAHLGVPCVTQVVDINPLDHSGSAEFSRGLDRGFRERVEAFLPVVATVSTGGPAAGVSEPPDISAAALLAARSCEVAVWDLADLGVPHDRVRRADQPSRYGRPRPRRPRLQHLAPPDPALPAFERIQKLLQGSVRHRGGRVVQLPADAIVDEIFQTLRDEGWLDHLRPGGGRGAEGRDHS
jgi:electron transfer flavoprotein alpha/beta subunit